MQNLDRFKSRWVDNKTEQIYNVKMLDIKDNYALVLYKYADEYTLLEEVNISDGILLQCTGIKDKNGVFIFEGDLIKYSNTIYTMKYIEEEAQFCLVSNILYDYQFYHHINNLEVIGNVYEHNELLIK